MDLFNEEWMMARIAWLHCRTLGLEESEVKLSLERILCEAADFFSISNTPEFSVYFDYFLLAKDYNEDNLGKLGLKEGPGNILAKRYKERVDSLCKDSAHLIKTPVAFEEPELDAIRETADAICWQLDDIFDVLLNMISKQNTAVHQD
jgi:hypothetical protein